MKRIKRLCMVLLALIMLVLPAGCGAKASPAPDRQTAVTAEQTDRVLREFLGVTTSLPDGDRGSRFYGSASERAAAEWLYAKYADKTSYPNLEVLSLEDTTFKLGTTQSGETVYSQNVIVRLPSVKAKADFKQIIIGTHYDNLYGTREDNTGTTSLGALDNGTGVATVMTLIDYFAAAGFDPGFDIVFAFFGAGTYGSTGSAQYIAKTMSVEEVSNTLMMFNVQRLGGDNLYLYSEEVETDYHAYLLNKSSAEGLGFNPIPRTIPIIEQSYVALPRLPYLHYAILGNHAPFMQQNIPVASLFTGNLDSFNLSDIEQWGTPNIGSSKVDVYSRMVAARPRYAEQMADAASLVVSAVRDEAFAPLMSAARKNMPDYDGALQYIWMYVGAIGFIVVLAVLLIVLVRHFEKKYPYVPPVKKLKIAVFGMEYESKNDTDVFVDIKKPKNPFDGY